MIIISVFSTKQRNYPCFYFKRWRPSSLLSSRVIAEWQQKRWQSFCWKWKTFIICEEKTNVFVISFVIPEKWWWQMTGVAKKCCWGRLQNDSLIYLRDLWRKREMTAVIENGDDRHFLDDSYQPPDFESEKYWARVRPLEINKNAKTSSFWSHWYDTDWATS